MVSLHEHCRNADAGKESLEQSGDACIVCLDQNDCCRKSRTAIGRVRHIQMKNDSGLSAETTVEAAILTYKRHRHRTRPCRHNTLILGSHF